MTALQLHPETLNGLSAVVTGGSRGLGLLVAEQLTERGCAVTVAARDAEELSTAEGFLRLRPGARVRGVVCDVTDQDAVGDLFRAADEEWGGVDVVVANAGVVEVEPADPVGPAEFRAAMETVFMGTLHTALAAMPYLRRSRVGGRLALIGSFGGLVTAPHLLPYSCAKSAVGTLAEGLHAEAAPHGVSVTAVHPGLIRSGTQVAAEIGGEHTDESAWFSALAGTPLVSMDARRAADRVVTALQRRRTRVVLTPAAKAADLGHGVAPATTARLAAMAGRVLPPASKASTGDETAYSEEEGESPDLDGVMEPPTRVMVRKLRDWGGVLGDRATQAYNQFSHRHSA